MTGLSISIVAYKFPTNPTCPPVKQKLRKFKPDKGLKIKEEVTKQIKAKVLRVVEYLTWLANIVPVPKKDGKVKSTIICEPIFKMLRKDAETSWIEDCQKVFDKIKEYLSTLPVLVLPELERPLLLYLSVLDGAFGCVLGRHDEIGRKEQAIYYLNFVKDRIVCRFGVLEAIITDNAANLNSDLRIVMCETFKIKHKISTAYRPQMNGAIEAANKNIKKILRKMVENHKQWHEKITFTLLGYCTMVRTSTGATPYMLIYGTEAVILAEVEILSLRVIHEVELSDAKWIKSSCEQLSLNDGKRMNSVYHDQLYQNRMSRAFNKRVKPRQFAPGQLVQKKILPHQDEAKGKCFPNWQVPSTLHQEMKFPTEDGVKTVCGEQHAAKEMFVVDEVVLIPEPSTSEKLNTKGLELAKSLGAKVIEAKCDSLLVVNQVNKSFEVREDRMQRYLDKPQVTLHLFKEWTLDHVPREQNSEANALYNLGSSVEENDIVPGIVTQLSRFVVEEGHAEINSTSLTWDWRNKYIDYLKNGKLQSDHKVSRALRIKAATFALDTYGTLYRRTFDGRLAVCLGPGDTDYVL
ncbi:uncharacterized protein [Nicotiana sylvestris]|uniref:uncharacterized protein n=1 Tax=Nicotiana sylvestris TaxID=4096 RepID=UPI00388CDDDD